MLHFKFSLCSYNLLLQLDSVANTVDGQMGKQLYTTMHACIHKIIVQHTVAELLIQLLTG